MYLSCSWKLEVIQQSHLKRPSLLYMCIPSFIQGIIHECRISNQILIWLYALFIFIRGWLESVMVDYLTSITLVICFLLQYNRGSNSFISCTMMTIYRIYSIYRDIGNCSRLKACHCIIGIFKKTTKNTKNRHFHALTTQMGR